MEFKNKALKHERYRIRYMEPYSCKLKQCTDSCKVELNCNIYRKIPKMYSFIHLLPQSPIHSLQYW